MALGKSRTLTFAKCEAVVSEILYASGTPRNGRSGCGRLIQAYFGPDCSAKWQPIRHLLLVALAQVRAEPIWVGYQARARLRDQIFRYQFL